MSDSLVVEWKNWKKCITIFHSGSSDHTKLQNILSTIIFQLGISLEIKNKTSSQKKSVKSIISFHLKTYQHKYGCWLINYHVSEIHHIVENGGFKSGKFPVSKENRATFKGIRALTTLTEMGPSHEIMGQRGF